MALGDAALRSVYLQAGKRARGHPLPTLLLLPGAAVDVVHLWRRRYEGRARALALDDRLLNDIGVDRPWADRTWRWPFWRA